MRDTVWAGKPQRLVMEDGTPKGAEIILKERGINTKTVLLEDKRAILANHEDFRVERNALTTMLGSRGHSTLYSDLSNTVTAQQTMWQ